MAAAPSARADRTLPCRLVPFEPRWAALVVSWVQDAREAYWLAPRTPPPITDEHVLRWQEPGHQAYVLLPADDARPMAYGELNRLPTVPRQYWLGHLIVDPAWRGCGYGVVLTRLLLEEAFARYAAKRVTLVVFPDNTRALACYRAAGLLDDGYEWHTFPPHAGRVCLLRLAATGF